MRPLKHITVLMLTVCVALTSTQSIPQCISNANNAGKIACYEEDLTSITSDVFRRNSIRTEEIRSVELVRCTITDLSFLSNLKNLEILSLNGVVGLRSTHFTTATLSNMKDSLQELSITDIPSLQSVDGLKTVAWKELLKLEVRACGLYSIDSGIFSRTPTVTSYDFSSNQLRTLDMSAHTNSYAVVKLMASHNNIRQTEGLDELSRLEELDLSNNKLQSADFLGTLLASSLKNVDLSHNSLRDFVLPKVDTSYQLVNRINLQDNNIGTISDLASSNAKNVKVLDLSKNQQLRVAETTFSGLQELKELSLHDTSLTQITTHFHNLTKLETLRLHSNNIENIPTKAFVGTSALQTLELQDNMLGELPFLTSQEAPSLSGLKYIDISRNQLDSLKNFIATPRLLQLRMSGTTTTNRFSQLSVCSGFTQLPYALGVICAMDISSTDTCGYRTFVNLAKNQDGLLYNNKACCENPDHFCCKNPHACTSEFPPNISCPDQETLCPTIKVIDPSPTSTTTPTKSSNVTGDKRETSVVVERGEFENLYGSEQAVMAIGYVLALLFFVLAVILCMRRARSYDKWLKDAHDTEATMRSDSILPVQTRMSNGTWDDVDGPSTSKTAMASPKLGTLRKGSPKMYSKSLDSMSIASGHSQYSAVGKNTLSGRDKFKDFTAIEMNGRYVPPVSPMKASQSVDSEDSPTTLSVYSYASFQPERNPVDMSPNRRRHRSGGVLPSQTNHRRSRSEDFLDTRSIDSDLIPVKIQLQRKATVRDSPQIGRNTRSYSTAPYRVRKGGKKKSTSPLLAVKQMNRNPGAPSPPMGRRALPATPIEQIPLPSAMRSGSSLASSGGSDPHRNNSVFAMDNDEDFITTEMQIGFG